MPAWMPLIERKRLRQKNTELGVLWFVVRRAAVCGTVIAAAPLVADYQNAPLIRYFMPIFGLMLLATPWLSVMDALIMKDLGFKTFTQRNIVSTFAGGAAGIMLAFTPWAIWALVVQRVVSGSRGASVRISLYALAARV